MNTDLYSVPIDIVNLVSLFCKSSAVYLTTNCIGSGHANHAILPNKYGWNEIQALKNKNIIQIAINDTFSLFLSDDGNIWICGHLRDFDEIGRDFHIPHSSGSKCVPSAPKMGNKMRFLGTHLKGLGTPWSHVEKGADFCSAVQKPNLNIDPLEPSSLYQIKVK